ncbi:putative F-box domain-containing protein [Medicago truncatula]|uniref:Putative F-box domain-containing protein n=1 Tax=Medicago truncatula TaxID=3880 RepID=A0A396HJB5_MEDTR|nr:putative F-box domain-containing protein [Medicago truncatula]
MESDRTRSGMCLKNAEIANANAVKEAEEDIFHTKIPEPVITHILSFLPTKDAVRTSVLSKTWEHRWTFLTKLSLHDHRQNDLINDQLVRLRRTRNFVRFVDRALIHTDGIILDSFSLFLFGRYETSLLDAWFSNIFNRRRVKTLRIHSHFQFSLSGLVTRSLLKNSMLVEELELHTDLISTIKVPIMPMTIKELEILTHSIPLYNVPTPAKSFCFENLKLLKLCGINFKNDSPKYPSSFCLVSHS